MQKMLRKRGKIKLERKEENDNLNSIRHATSGEKYNFLFHVLSCVWPKMLKGIDSRLLTNSPNWSWQIRVDAYKVEAKKRDGAAH